MSQLEKAIDAMGKLSLLAQLRDKVVEARFIDRRQCGNCHFWMKSRECPREQNVNGFSRGPSDSDVACNKFQIKQWVLDLKAQRVHDAIAFAERHGLPIPPGASSISRPQSPPAAENQPGTNPKVRD